MVLTQSLPVENLLTVNRLCPNVESLLTQSLPVASLLTQTLLLTQSHRLSPWRAF
jgi:hypothetical protein